MGNGSDGVQIGSSSTVDNNVIRFNAVEGVRVGGGPNTVSNNIITDTVSDGVESNGGFNTIGGVSAGNLISRNFAGINDAGGINTIRGNTITNNTIVGVRLQIGTNTVGGALAGQSNTIKDNGHDGIAISALASVNDIKGNAINSNGNDGIRIISSNSTSMIGGVGTGADNTISFNGGDGVLIASGTGTAILGNTIFSNADLGIDLGTSGVTPNDAVDNDAGANNLQNFPVLTSAFGGSTTIEGTLNSVPNNDYRVEFFSNSECDPSGNGEGETFIGTANVTTDASGTADFVVTVPANVPAGHLITATVTDSGDNTSEFSRCTEVLPLPPPLPDVFVYSAKITCVPHLGPASPALMPGKYRTAVNVHNPSDEPAHIQKWVTLSPPQGQTPITGGRISETLGPWSAFDVDCPHMRDQFGLPEGAKVPGGKGFLVIRSDQRLDVVAVYTARTETANKNGVGTSIDVETVEPK